MNGKIDNINRHRKNIFVGEMPDENLVLSLDGEEQIVKVLGRFCVRTDKVNGNYVVVLIEEDNKEDVVIFRWNADQIEIILDKEEWETVTQTWKSILATVEHGERMEFNDYRGTSKTNQRRF